MVSISAECWPLCRPRYLPIVGRYVDLDLADISVDTSADISWLLYRPRVGRYVDRHIGQVWVDMSTDTSVKCRPIYQSRGTQNTHDPLFSYCSLVGDMLFC